MTYLSATKIIDATTQDIAKVNSDGRLHTIIKGIISVVNSTSTPLLADTGGSDHIFTGPAEDITDVAAIFVNVFTDEDSATNGLMIQQSSDGTNWDHEDEYSIFAGSGKNYNINPHSEYLRVVYINGTSQQTVLRLQVIYKFVYATPSSHRLGDDIKNDDDAQLNKSVIVVETNDKNTYKNVNLQNPLPVDGDSVYGKDLNLDRTTTTDWTGKVSDLFGDLTLGMINTLGTSPKTLTIFFQRTIITNAMGLGADTGNFSNVKITALLSGSATFVLFDGSADSTLRTSQTIQFIPLGFVGIEIEFSTTNTVTLTNVVILKSVSTVSRLQAIKPDGIVTNIDATAGSNLKISLEELENQISSNSNSQLNVTLFNEEGIPASIDASTETLQTIDHSHHKILEGDAYTAKVQAEGGVGTKAIITFTTSDTAKWMHIIIHARSNVEAHYTLGESPTITADTGTNFIVYNRNRNSDNESLTKGTRTATAGQMTEGATVTNLGTILEQVHLGSGRAGGENRSDDEWVLKQNTTYVLECESEAATSDVLIEIDWYEHTNKN